MPNVAIVGAQWGDEGKGKIVDLLSDRFDVVARFQGGPNAGHTVTIGAKRHALHHVPSGVFRPEARIVIGNGTVIDLAKLIEEIDGLAGAGIDLAGRLFISDRAHVILPMLKRIDAIDEAEAGEAGRIGTTLRGIGPTYQAKAARWGIRLADLADAGALLERVRSVLAGPTGERIRAAGERTDSAESVASEAHRQYRTLEPFVADTTTLLNDWLDQGLDVLFEGAQGTMLDLDHGSYPFVTSSNTMAGALCAGLGVAPTRVTGTIGVFKAYATRVGSGPMPTELGDAIGDRIRERGREFGTTTGRPRRCGWFDGVAARYAARINRFDGACISLLDVLDDFDEVRICVAYELGGERLGCLPASAARAASVRPVYETMPGWRSDTTGIRRWDRLPRAALAYLDRLSEIIGSEVVLVGVGPEREQSIVKPGGWLERQLAS
ncbi:MAG TPA: adenylosuccinate synthase [Candidatus Polarisedimenticolaceae bacterium]|nr:adenylosuccinate synthase [Candidatus Polarisedimenticolaceae bacterium]